MKKMTKEQKILPDFEEAVFYAFVLCLILGLFLVVNGGSEITKEKYKEINNIIKEKPILVRIAKEKMADGIITNNEYNSIKRWYMDGGNNPKQDILDKINGEGQ